MAIKRAVEIFFRRMFIRFTSTSTRTMMPAQQFKPSTATSSTFPQPPDPLSCCGSGCANCVWIQYADEISAYFDQPKVQPSNAHKILNKYKAVKEEMEKNVEDENLRSYLLMEIKAKLAKK
uniref:Oxidoreductase-like domain-containing protein n=1 Tax=Panagrolaimus sp. JU765 TaxID=591449 RepID=A0AC34Q6N1_9BILA